MAKKTLNLTKKIEASLAYVFFTFSNKSGWMEWFSHKVYGYSSKNEIMRMHNEPEGEFAFHFTDEEANQKIAFNFIKLETMEISEVEITFEEDGDVVTVSLEHRGLSEGEVEQTRSLWEKGFENLKSVIEEGKDLRVWNRPFIGVLVADWITPEIAAEKDLPVDFGMQLNSTIAGGGAEKAGLIKGDIISSAAGHELHDFNQFLEFIGTVKAGDQVDLEYYRDGKKYQLVLTLTAYPVEPPPADAHDLADQIKKFQAKAVKRLVKTFEESNPAQAAFRPGPGEWSAKETLAHLVAYETDSQIWITTLVGGCEEYPCQSSHPVRIKALLSLYPTVGSLIEEWQRRQQHTVAIIQELPAEFVNRKGTYGRAAGGLNLDYTRHYKEHLSQIVEALEKAENVREG